MRTEHVRITRNCENLWWAVLRLAVQDATSTKPFASKPAEDDRKRNKRAAYEFIFGADCEGDLQSVCDRVGTSVEYIRKNVRKLLLDAEAAAAA